MAGIGFTLRRLMQHEGAGAPVAALAYAATLAAGPWLSSSLALAGLGFWGALGTSSQGGRVFFGIVTYTFAASLVVAGGIQLVAARYLADRLYERQLDAVASAFVWLLVPLLAVQAALAAAFVHTLALPAMAAWSALVLYLAVSGTWLALTFLAAARAYHGPVLAFALGMAVALVGGAWGGARAGLAGQLGGFATGATLTFVVLVVRVIHEFGLPGAPTRGLDRYFRRYVPLLVAGIAYNLGCWVDKLGFWLHPLTGEHVAGALWASPIYDDAMFGAYLTVVPALGTFLLVAETSFYEAFRGYFAAIEARADLGALTAAREGLGDALWRGLVAVAKVQVPVTALVVVFAPELLRGLGVSWNSLYVFRYGAFGAMLQVYDLFLMVYLLYLNVPGRAAALAVTFLAANVALTAAAFGGGWGIYGLGYAAAAAVTFGLGCWLVERSLDDLPYRVFMRQPFEAGP